MAQRNHLRTIGMVVASGPLGYAAASADLGPSKRVAASQTAPLPPSAVQSVIDESF